MSSWGYSLLAGVCLLPLAFGQVFVGSNSSQTSISVSLPAPANISSNCNATFTTEVTCDRNLPSIAFGGYFPSSDDLTELCNSDCLQSLESQRIAQADACSSDTMMLEGMTYPITATVDVLLWAYNYTCRRDASTGDFCQPIFDSWASGNASDEVCSDCVLGTYQIQLGSAMVYDDELASNFSSMTSSCQATGYPITSPTPLYINATATATATTTASATPSNSCVSNYTVQAGDDCHSISVSQQVSTSELLYFNNLEAGCTDFPSAGTSLCIPHTCEVYTVQQNDTCWDLAEASNGTFSIAQLVSWNIDISNGCENLELLVGNQICVTYPGETPVVSATGAAATATTAPVPTNVVEGTNTNCSKYYQVADDDTCASITQIYSISLADFYFLNPEINSTSCNNLYLDYSYCVQPVGDISTYAGYGGSSTSANPCIGGTTTAPESCYATSYSTIEAWTFPPVNTTGKTPGASNSTTWVSYTVSSVPAYPVTATSYNPTPTPYQSGMVAGCTDFYFVVANDTCADIADRWGVSIDNLYAWNPDVKTDCSGLIAGDYICMAQGTGTVTTALATATATATSTATATTTNAASATAPGPTQTGIPDDCADWVLQSDNVYCADMANNAGISLACFYQMNPAVNTTAGECQGLLADYAYCIGTESNECS
ncbi:LysM domain-containing protein [Colletotrichum siamense]|uniref:LysM domain-containing protein n=1 Tax=Colletotrichum siamense TaxID=690259 RepID=UPI0018722612|nr:LysM domain-containing protein [Colletotrichum siamense]KAF5511762.1 LysM domain-containing protein [Colletotrichum siamense]